MNEHDLQERKAFMEEAEALLGKNDYIAVLSLAESRLKRTPGDMDARIVICRVWIDQERLEEAGKMLREMEDILASLSQIYTCMGDIYLRKGMAESAQDFYRTFVSLNPDTTMARKVSEKLKGISEQSATDSRERAEKEAAAPVSDDFQTVTLAELYARQGHLQMAEEILEAILRKGPHHPKAAELLREVRERIACQEKPEEKYVPEMLPDVGERIVGHDEPEKRSVAEILREARERIVGQEEPAQKHAPVIAELSRWLDNIGRLRSHAA
jgi:thioredoxin-like negative regulator of GroEL